ncbi:cytochrome c [Vitreoscilla massiliensis]|uniref:Cytochrome c n=1 Tax=Vitreoscilla massiliensis TaxID=1689272 RepID=A0ABY4E3V5_9NEIS|nr:cytochrome c [Vitreoscilla massiliensis]UOO90460.1 cytochrome c [Vitreoscilla massiliensis]
MKLLSAFCLLSFCLITSACSSADEVKRGPHSQARHQGFTAMMPNYTKMVQMTNGNDGYQKAEFAKLVAQFEAEAQQPFTHFEQDEPGMDGKAKAEIWQNSEAFAQQQAAFFASIAALKTAAAHSNQDEIRSAIKQVDKQCMSCHSTYRD